MEFSRKVVSRHENRINWNEKLCYNNSLGFSYQSVRMKQGGKLFLEVHMTHAQPVKIVIVNRKVKNAVEEDIEKGEEK